MMALRLGRAAVVRSGAAKRTWAAATFARAELSTAASKPAPIAVLCILDGWGYNEHRKMNAVLQGNTPNFDRIFGHRRQLGQQTFLHASERHVGLPAGQIGNSEVGHMNIGAGRVVWQDICTIDNAIADGSLASQEALKGHIAKLKETGGTSHLIGLVSPGGVHALQSHIAALANEINRHGVPVVVHAFTDGRDVPPQDAIHTIPEFMASLDPGVKVATVTGRYYGMDRDNRWERVGQAYDAIVLAKGQAAGVDDPLKAVEQAYAAGKTDEFVPATIIGDYAGAKSGDGILMANFRADRAREILRALADPNPPAELGFGAERPERPTFASLCGIVEYGDHHNTFIHSAIFPPKDIQNTVGEVVAKAGLKQLRIAESEKAPHVSFFISSRDEPFEGEDRILLPSPKVATYDLQPEMNAPMVRDKVCEAISSGKYGMVILNFANPDMVGHTGSLEAAIKAVECVDQCLGEVERAVAGQKGALIVTADHGNCEQMWDETTNGPHTAHTLNKVPVILADFREYSETDEEPRLRQDESAALCDLAPTILDILGLEQPAEMTGKSLIAK